MTGPGARDEVQVFAQVELGGILIGIPAQSVVRALPRPAALTQLPRAGIAIDGVFNDGDQLVPLVDLRRWMAGAQPDSVPRHVIVLDADGCSVGLAVDAIRGLARVPADHIRQVHHDDGQDEFFHSVATLDDGTLVSLLDPLRMMSQVRVWAPGGQGERHPRARTAGTAASPATLFALVRIAGSLVAVDTNQVGEVVHDPLVQPLELGDSKVTGILQRRGQHVPVLAGARTLGLASPAEQHGRPLVLLLSDQARTVALPIEAVDSIQPIDTSTLLPPHDAGLSPDACFTGVARTATGERLLLLDSEKLLATYAAPGLSRDGDKDVLARGVRKEDTLAEAHIVVHAGLEWAISMAHVHEIAVLPDDFEALPAASHMVAGSAGWRGRSLPVLDLRGDAASVDRRRARMVVVQHAARHAALLVDDLTALLPSNTASRSRFKLAGGALVDMLTVSAAGARKSYPVMNLGDLPFFAAAA